jgi:hypothetical protein
MFLHGLKRTAGIGLVNTDWLFASKEIINRSSSNLATTKKMNKTCLECNDKIVGREDKKFCSDGCRNSYNNKINKDSTNFMRNVNNKLRKNYRILGALNSEGKSKTTRAKLLSKGFDFEFVTNILNTKTGNTYYFIYDQGYMALENDYFMLVKKDI